MAPTNPISIPRAAKLIGMSANWLRGRVDAGDVPCTRPGKQRRVLLTDVLKIVKRENGAPRIAVYPHDHLD